MDRSPNSANSSPLDEAPTESFALAKTHLLSEAFHLASTTIAPSESKGPNLEGFSLGQIQYELS